MTPTQDKKQDPSYGFSSEAGKEGSEERKRADLPSEAANVAKEGEQRRQGPDLDLIRAGATVMAILGFIALLHFASSVFITLFSAMMLAFALEPIVGLLCVRTRLRRPHASGIVVFLFVAMLYVLCYAAYLRAEIFIAEIPEITEKIRAAPLVAKITNRAEELNRVVAEAGRRIAPRSAVAVPPKTTSPAAQDGESFTGTLLQGLGSMTNILFALGFIPFLVYFMLADREPLTRRTRELFPEQHRATVGEILLDIERMMRKFLFGNAVIAIILSVATVLVFGLVGLPYPVILGILSGILSIVPYIGLPLALLPGLGVALVSFDSGGGILVLIVSVTVFHLAAANFLTPRLVGREVHLNATASTVALLFFGWLWGGMGLILGIPILAVMKCIFDNIPSTQRIGLFLGE